MQEAEMNQEPSPLAQREPSPASPGPRPRPSPPPAVAGQHGAAVPGSREERNRLKRVPVLETRTPIPEGLDAPGAGAQNVDAWLRRTFGMTSEEAVRVTGHNSLRQIVYQLDAIASGEGGPITDEDAGDPSLAEPGEPIPVAEGQAPMLQPERESPPFEPAPVAESESESGHRGLI